MPNKALGQHWLKDRLVLEEIVDSAEITPHDTVLEIGPGLGTLTSVLLSRAKSVIAIEYDEALAQKLPDQFPGKDLQVIHADFLTFDLGSLPKGYKVVANIPYYITQKILEQFIGSTNQPQSIALLVQKEVAEKLAEQPGRMTAIAVKLQLHYDVQLGTRVPKEYFTPPPLIDSQVVLCKKNHVSENEDIDMRRLLRVVNAGFSAPRKKLYAALSGGLAVSKEQAKDILHTAGISPDCRASDVAASRWIDIAQAYDTI